MKSNFYTQDEGFEVAFAALPETVPYCQHFEAAEIVLLDGVGVLALQTNGVMRLFGSEDEFDQWLASQDAVILKSRNLPFVNHVLTLCHYQCVQVTIRPELADYMHDALSRLVMAHQRELRSARSMLRVVH